jgi:predicted RNA-binding protein with PIN domain
MTNKIIIDAWNVIWKMPALAELIPERLGQVRSQFNMIIKNYYYNKNVIYKIIYDGQPLIYSHTKKDNPNVSFSRNPEKADDLIIKYVNNQSNPAQWTVITSDRYLAHRVKNSGAYIASAESFLSKIKKFEEKRRSSDRHEKPQIRKDDISYWLDKFKSTD